MDRVLLANRALALVSDATYLEIGIAFGGTFRAVCAPMKIGVDPHMRSRRHRIASVTARARSRLVRRGELLFALTSDQFFATQRSLLARRPPNIVLVDGLHTAAQSHRDVIQALEVLDDSGVIMLHDCDPPTRSRAAATHEESCRIEGYDGKWNGEVWRTIVRLRALRSDLRVCVLDCDEGLGLVARGVPDSTVNLRAEEIQSLTFDDFRSDRVNLLDLRPPEYAFSFISAALH